MKIKKNKTGYTITLSEEQLNTLNSAMLDAGMYVGKQANIYRNDDRLFSHCINECKLYSVLYYITGYALNPEIYSRQSIKESIDKVKEIGNPHYTSLIEDIEY